MVQKVNKKVINGWAMYDWANSVYSLVITSAIFPVYYQKITSAPDGSQQVISFFSWHVDNVSLQSYALSVAFLIAALISPLLSGIADYSGKKKFFMKIFSYLGAFSCIALGFFYDMDTLETGVIAFILAGVGYTGSIVFYNAYLPEIAPPEMQDKVSAKGFAYGYVGSVILLLINLLMLMFPEKFFLKDSGEAARASFVMTGLWWMGFARITFARLPDNVYKKKARGNYLMNGYREVAKVFRQILTLRSLALFLLAFFTLSMGLQTVMYMAPTFAEKEVDMPTDMLILLVLILQLLAIAGAYFFSWLSSKMGNLRALMTAVFIWSLVVLAVYFTTQITTFLIVASVVGFIMGGSQSLARSSYSKMLPVTTDHASFFSFYDITEKVAIVLGTFAFGYINEVMGGMRSSILFLLSFFVLSLLIFYLLYRYRKRSVA